LGLHGLDAKYGSASSLSKLTCVLPNPMKMDKATQDKDKIVYAHILVELQIEDTISVTTEFANEKEIVMQQAIHYAWKPLKCTHCKFLGEDKDCRRKKVVI